MKSTTPLLIFALLAATPLLASASPPTINTVCGTGQPHNNGHTGKALEINVGDTFGVEIGPDGALYVTEVRNHRVRRLDLKTGQLTTVAGNGRKGYSGDGGPATHAELNEPYEVRFDQDGNMFFVEMQNHIIRKIDATTGLISTVVGAGPAHRGAAGDGGPATQAHSIALMESASIPTAPSTSATHSIIVYAASRSDVRLPSYCRCDSNRSSRSTIC